MKPDGPSPPLRLLVIDDEESILFAMWDFLTQRGYHVDQARNRREAETLLETAGPYALVVVDLRLDVFDPRGGLRLLRHVREISPQTRTILLTAFGSPDVEAELAVLGADRLLSKPQPLDRLAHEVELLLRSSGILDRPNFGRYIPNPKDPDDH